MSRHASCRAAFDPDLMHLMHAYHCNHPPPQHPSTALLRTQLCTTQVAAGNNLTLVGFRIHASSPSASLLPDGTVPPLNVTFYDAGMPVPNLFGSLLPSFLAFAAPQPEALGTSAMTLSNMELVYASCDTLWRQITQTLATPAGVGSQSASRSPEDEQVLPYILWHA